MTNNSQLIAVDDDITKCIDGYPAKFWASAERNPREDMHAFMQYPAMMVPEIQRELIKVVYKSQKGITNVLDPFVGAATTMTSCMPLGLNFTGQDINPLAILISQTKTGPFDDELLEKCVKEVLKNINNDKYNNIDADFINIDKWFQPNVKQELSKIRRGIRDQDELWVRRFLWVGLAETIRLVCNSRTSTYKLHIRPKDEVNSRNLSAIQVFQSRIIQNLQDLKTFKHSLEEQIINNAYKGKLAIYFQDSSKIILPPHNSNQYDLLITSPPYGDNLSTVSYGQFSYLPLQWIDLTDIDPNLISSDMLRTTQEIDRKSLGGNKIEDTDFIISYLVERSPTYVTILKKLKLFPKDRLSRVTSFIYDLDKSITPIVKMMRKNAYLIWIIGNRHVGGEEIPSDKILEELLLYQKVILVKRFNRQILYRRMASRNQRASMMRTENILVFRKHGN